MKRSAFMMRAFCCLTVLLRAASPVLSSDPEALSGEPDPLAGEPAASQPVTQGETTKQPATRRPAIPQPVTSRPASTQPATTQVAESQPATTQAATSQPTTQPTTQPATSQPTTQPATTQPAASVVDDTTDMVLQDGGVATVRTEGPVGEEPEQRRIINSAAIGTRREPDPTGYVRSLAEQAEQFEVEGLESFSWLDLGIDQRTRFEIRDNYYRAEQESGTIFLMRNRAYLGVRKILDPFRFGIEFQDARRFGADLDDQSNIDENEILQLFGELYFKDLAGEGYPVRFRVGRMSFDFVDRRLIARNRFRNNTNAFDGFRLTLGQETTDWQIDFFAARPMERRQRSPNPSDEEKWVYGMVGYWRALSPWLNLATYYIILDYDAKDPDVADELIHTIGLHGFGLIGDTGLDYDFDTAFQFGEDGDLNRRAFAMHAELGYTLEGPYSARAAAWVNYASGDRDPDDGVNQRFDRLYGASHSMYGYSDLFTWSNMINPTAYFSFSPTSNLRVEAFYRAYWLASSTDAWPVPGLRDSTGENGSFIGQELDFRGSWQINRNLGFQVGYAHFIPGTFVTRTARRADDSDFFYISLALRL